MGCSTTSTPGPHIAAARSAVRGAASIVTGSNRAIAFATSACATSASAYSDPHISARAGQHIAVAGMRLPLRRKAGHGRLVPSRVAIGPYSSGRRSRKSPHAARWVRSASRSNEASSTASPSRSASATLAPVASAMNDEP
jgi:hypothetical protein